MCIHQRNFTHLTELMTACSHRLVIWSWFGELSWLSPFRGGPLIIYGGGWKFSKSIFFSLERSKSNFFSWWVLCSIFFFLAGPLFYFFFFFFFSNFFFFFFFRKTKWPSRWNSPLEWVQNNIFQARISILKSDTLQHDHQFQTRKWKFQGLTELSSTKNDIKK